MYYIVKYLDHCIGLFTEEEALKYMHAIIEAKRIEGCEIEKEDEKFWFIDDGELFVMSLDRFANHGKIEVVLSMYDTNGPEYIGFNTMEKALEYFFTEIISLQRDPNDEWVSWIEEKDNCLWFHSGKITYGDNDTLFELRNHVNAPKTIEELRKWMLDGNDIDIGWSDRGSCNIRLHKMIYQPSLEKLAVPLTDSSPADLDYDDDCEERPEEWTKLTDEEKKKLLDEDLEKIVSRRWDPAIGSVGYAELYDPLKEDEICSNIRQLLNENNAVRGTPNKVRTIAEMLDYLCENKPFVHNYKEFHDMALKKLYDFAEKLDEDESYKPYFTIEVLQDYMYSLFGQEMKLNTPLPNGDTEPDYDDDEGSKPHLWKYMTDEEKLNILDNELDDLVKKRKQRKSGSTRPKRPLSAYNQYVKEQIALASPLPFSKIVENWKALSDKDREPYQKLSEKDYKRWSYQCSQYVASKKNKVPATFEASYLYRKSEYKRIRNEYPNWTIQAVKRSIEPFRNQPKEKQEFWRTESQKLRR